MTEIKQVSKKDLKKCLAVIHESFKTVAEEFHLTPNNCPANGAFMKYSALYKDYKKGCLMFAAYEKDLTAVFFALEKIDAKTYELQKLAVIPPLRHKGIGALMLEYAKNQAIQHGAEKITIGIIEENTILKNWYISKGFIHTGTKKFPHLPFTVGFMELKCK